MLKFTNRIVSVEDFRKSFRDEVCTIGYFGKRLGRRPHTVLGTEKKPIDRDVGALVAQKLVAKLEAEGRALDPKLVALRELTGARQWAGHQISTLSRFDPKEGEAENEVFAFFQAAGDLLPIGKKHGNVKIYITTAGATPVEVACFIALCKEKGAADSRRNNSRLLIAERYEVIALQTGLSVEDNYAQFCERYTLPRAP